ncbi:hypothetical protein BC829DRAFT_471380 [Chytridium lagenaria]|nr:hypothetical protein BC829DRAFT_471380 [Chytridium lagenaria]
MELTDTEIERLTGEVMIYCKQMDEDILIENENNLKIHKVTIPGFYSPTKAYIRLGKLALGFEFPPHVRRRLTYRVPENLSSLRASLSLPDQVTYGESRGMLTVKITARHTSIASGTLTISSVGVLFRIVRVSSGDRDRVAKERSMDTQDGKIVLPECNENDVVEFNLSFASEVKNAGEQKRFCSYKIVNIEAVAPGYTCKSFTPSKDQVICTGQEVDLGYFLTLSEEACKKEGADAGSPQMKLTLSYYSVMEASLRNLFDAFQTAVDSASSRTIREVLLAAEVESAGIATGQVVEVGATMKARLCIRQEMWKWVEEEIEMVYEIEMDCNWMVSGRRRGTFIMKKNEDKEFELILVPIITGLILFPAVTVNAVHENVSASISCSYPSARHITIVPATSGKMLFHPGH